MGVTAQEGVAGSRVDGDGMIARLQQDHAGDDHHGHPFAAAGIAAVDRVPICARRVRSATCRM